MNGSANIGSNVSGANIISYTGINNGANVGTNIGTNVGRN